MSVKICHISSVHPRYDVRIYVKEILSLKTQGYNVSLLLADGKGNDKEKQIYDIGKSSNRITRILFGLHKLYREALRLNCDIYHFHDPELITIAKKLKRKGKKVIYDVHEDLPRQMLSKPYLKKFFPKLISQIVENWENSQVKQLDYIITSTPHIKDRFQKITDKVESIKNFPMLEEFKDSEPTALDKKDQVCYIGSLTEVRGIYEIVEACRELPVNLNIAGNFHDEDYKTKVMNSLGWKDVNYMGYINRSGISELLNRSLIGIVTLYPIENHLTSYPVKMFEYMASGIPVIASNFDTWKEIVEGNECGLCVDSENINEIRSGIKYLLNNPKIAARMGQNGRQAVMDKYNWTIEEKKLFSIYEKVIKK